MNKKAFLASLPVFLLILLMLQPFPLWSQSQGTLAGKVIDVQTNEPLTGVLVKIGESDITSLTDEDGNFLFEKLAEGEYSLSLQKPKYGRTIFLSIPVIAGEVTYKEIFLQKSAREGEVFYIGGIEVAGERELLPEKAATTTRIHSGEIEHLQASSLADILELLPGQKFSNPGLEDVKQVRLRNTTTTDAADQNASFGTQVVIDDIPVSNNANLQLDTKLNTGADYRITTGSGVDLRRIPAENIESVEIIRGIPPARFGDLSAGTILVKTREGHTPFRMKYKYNPRNKEANFGGGYGWKSLQTNLNLNYAHSVRNIRVPGDSYERLAFQWNIDSWFAERKLKWENRFYFTRTFDEQNLREGDLTETERYNRSYTLRFNSGIIYEWNTNRSLESRFSVNMDRENSQYRAIITRDIGVISTRMSPGIQEGFFVSSYRTELNVKGRAWNIFGRLEYKDQLQNQGLLHQWLTGINIQHEFNNGAGREFDPRYPPRSSDNQGDRPRRYDEVPALTQITWYFQDEITGHLWRDFTLQLGFRYEMFDPYRLDWSRLRDGLNPVQSHHGNFFSPRINFMQYFSRTTQFRAGYGRTAKVPPLSMVYPNPLYYDVVDTMYFDPIDPANRFALVSTYIYDPSVPDLRASVQDKFEVSLDQRIGSIGLSLTGFYEEMEGGYITGDFIPLSFIRYSRPDWPDGNTAIPRDTVLLGHTRAMNAVYSRTRGVEFSVTTKRLPQINTSIRIDAAYHHTRSWFGENYFERGSQRSDPYLKEMVRPFWNPVSSWSDNLIINYRFDALAKPLGLWFTVAIQQIVMERDSYIGLGDSMAVGYYRLNGETVYIPEDHRGDAQYQGLRRSYEPYNFITESRPGLWLFNLRASKSLWKGGEASFFVNNLFNSRPLYLRERVPPGSMSYIRRNPEIFYGVEVSMIMDDLVHLFKRY